MTCARFERVELPQLKWMGKSMNYKRALSKAGQQKIILK